MRLRIPQRVAIGVAAMALFGALPAVAGATDYCVVPNAGCGGTNVDTFQKALALAAASPDADRIFLGAFNYVAPTTAGFDFSKSGPPVEIVGQGAGQTILTAPPGATSVLRLFGNGASSVHDLSIRIPANAGADVRGLTTDGVARRIGVAEDSQQVGTHRTGVQLENGGTLEDSSVKLKGIPTRGVWTDTGGGTVRDSTISAYFAVSSAYGATIERSHLVAAGGGVIGGRNLTTVANSFILIGQGGVALAANPQPGSPATLNADGVTIAGIDRVTTRAVWASTTAAPSENATVNVSNSIIRGGRLETYAAGTGHASIALSYSDIDVGDPPLGPNQAITKTNVSDVGDAGFADPMLGDFHLLPSSPLIDAGDPNTSGGTDMDGKPRVVDGNGDGIARRDMGAFEYQTGSPAPGGPAQPPSSPGGATPPVDTQAPLIGGFRATPSLFALARASTPVSAGVAHGTRFRYTLSEPAKVKLTIQRALPGRRSGGRCVAPSPRVRHPKRCIRYTTVGALRRSGAKGANAIRFSGKLGRRALRMGRYRAVISATDTAGNRSGLRSTAFRIAPG